MSNGTNTDYDPLLDPISGLTGQKRGSLEPPDTGEYDPAADILTGFLSTKPSRYVGDYVGGEPSKFDKGITFRDLDNIERNRAIHQSSGGQAFNAIVGGVASGVLTAVEDIGYILDFKNNIKRLQGLEEVDTNDVSKWAQGMKGELERVMPIHRMSDKVFDWTDSGFYWQMFKGVADSAVGFAIPGMLATRGIGAIQRLARTTKYLNKLRVSTTGKQLINAGLGAYVTNYGESKMMGLEQYENSLRNMTQELFRTNYEILLEDKDPNLSNADLREQAMVTTQAQLASGIKEDFEEIAGKHANSFMWRNKAFMITDMIGLHGLYRGKGITRDLVKQGKQISDNLLLQAGKEGLEEIGQNILQMEGEYQSLKEIGATSEAPENLSERILDFATSDQALLEGLMGVLGGGPQRILTKGFTGGYSRAAREERTEREDIQYEEQQKQVQANKDYLSGKLSRFSKSQLLREQASARGLERDEKLLRDVAFVEMVAENAERGTLGQFERSIKDVRNGVSPEVEGEGEWDPDYKEIAAEQLTDLKRMEKQWLKYHGYYNHRLIFLANEKRKLLQQNLESVTAETKDIQNDIDIQEETGTVDPELKKDLIRGLTSQENIKNKIKEADELFTELISDEYQADEKKKAATRAKEAQTLYNETKEKRKKENAKDKSDRRKKSAEDKANEKREREAEVTVDVEAEVVPPEPTIDPTVEDKPKKKAPVRKPKAPKLRKPTPEEQGTQREVSPFAGTTEVTKPVPQVYDDPKKQAARDRMAEDGKKLRDSFTDEDVLESELAAPTEGAELSPAAERFLALERMVNDAKLLTGDEDPTLSDIVDVLIEDSSYEEVERIFGRLEGLYKQINPNYEYTDSLERFRELTPDERVELEGAKKVADVVVVTQYTTKTEEEVERQEDGVKRTMHKIDQPVVNPDDPSDYNYKRVKSGSSKLAYLSRAYDQAFVDGQFTIVETTDALNEIGDPNILARDAYGPGTPLTVRVMDQDDHPAYEEGTFERTETTWGAKKNTWQSMVDKKIMTQAEYDQRVIEQMPIGIYNADGKLAAHLHETEWINESRISGDVDEDKARSVAIRKFLIDRDKAGQKEYNTTVQSNSSGYPVESIDGYIPVSEAFKDETLEMFIGSQEERKLSRKVDHVATGEFFNNKEVLEGVLYASLPIVDGKTVAENKNLAVPLKTSQLDNHPEVINAIMKAMDIFYGQNVDPSHDTFIEFVKDHMDIDLNHRDGFTAFVKAFIRDFDTGDNPSLQDVISGSQYAEYENDAFVSMNKLPEGDTNFQIARGRGTGAVQWKDSDGQYTYLSRRSIAAMDDNLREAHYEKLTNDIRDELERVFLHASLTHLNAGGNIVTLDNNGVPSSTKYKEFVRDKFKTKFLGHNIGTEENPKYIYAIQPVIQVDFNEALGVEPTKVEKEPEAEVIPAIAPDPVVKELAKPKTKRKLNKLDFEVDPEQDELTSESAAVLREETIEAIRKKSEVEPEVSYRIEDRVKHVRRTSGVIIGDMDSAKEKQIVDYLRSVIVAKIVKTENRELDVNIELETHETSFTKTLNAAKENLEILAEEDEVTEEIENEIAINRATVRAMQQIVDNYDSISALVKTKLERIAKDEEPEIDPENDEDENVKAERQSQDWGGDGNFTLNRVTGLASELKYFLSGIGKYRVENGKAVPELTYFKRHKPMSFQEVYNQVQRLTVNKTPSFDILLNHLESYTKGEKLITYPFMGDLIEKLRKAPEQVKIQFVVGMTNHDHNMRHLQFDKTSKATKLVAFDSNANTINQRMIADWNRALIANSAVPHPDGDGSDAIPKKVRDYIMNTHRKWRKENIVPDRNEVREYLKTAGIILTEKGLTDMLEGKIHYGRRKRKASALYKKGGVLDVIAKYFRNLQNDPIVPGYEFTKDNAIKALARHDADYVVDVFSDSFRTGRKTVYAYGQNNFMVNRTRELTEIPGEENPLVNQLNKIPFNSTSLWLEGLQVAPDKIDGSNLYRDNLGRWVESLEPLKKKGTADKDNRQMSKLSEDAIELNKVGMIETGDRDKSGKNQRVISILYPTTSDKTTPYGIRVPAQTMPVEKDGSLADESIQMIMDYVVQPEINRIQAYQKIPEKQRPDIENYEGGAQMFLFLPQINTIPGLFNSKGDISEDVNSPLMKQQMKDIVRKYMNSMIEEKMKFWKKTGIITDSTTPYLDSGYLDGKFNGENTPMENVAQEAQARVAATDMVFQYLIGHAEVSKLFIGDPALYYQQAAHNKGVAKSNPKYDFVADAKLTYINMGKRLAADIAPGYELADSQNNEYIQAFGADMKTSSVLRFELTRLLDGEEHYKAIKDLEGTKAGVYARSKNLVSKAYYDFKSTDAQEYTTWREHLYVMKHLGEISTIEYNEAYALLKAGNPLGDTLLGKIMQPMKPVYVDNLPDIVSGVDRRVYIKSSSFPLIPQLVRGSQLDNLRQAMEGDPKTDKDVVKRFAYSTAVKVGNFTNPVNIFDADGNIKPADQIDFTGSTLTLKRKGFRIQQKVPYKSDVAEINRITQASKNLLVNMLGVEGFSVPWHEDGKEINGKTLQEIYAGLFQEIHQVERDSLIREVRNKNGNLNINKLKSILRKEARDRNFPVSDQEMLELTRELNFISMSPSSDKYEALLNSIVYNRVVKFTMPGLSYVLGSEEGLKPQIKAVEDLTAEEISEIIYTNNWNGKHLLPARPDEKTGERRGAQVFVPWKFRNQDGELISIRKYVTKDEKGRLILDSKKIPKEIFEMFGMRIPNQGPNSQSYIEIAGFLPEASGNLLIATRDHIAQMGSDFDVDKLYTYMYNMIENEEGIEIYREQILPEDASPADIKKNKIKDLQNKIIDSHLAVHKNPDKKVQTQIANPLGLWKLKEAAEKIEKYHDVRKEEIRQRQRSVVTYSGGYIDKGKGTPEGDGKDEAMRKVADGFIGEAEYETSELPQDLRKGKGKSSTMTSFYTIGSKGGYHGDYYFKEETPTITSGKLVSADDYAKTIMLARNAKFEGQPLSAETRAVIEDAFSLGSTFIVGDMPNVDSHFVDFLQEIGADFTIYHTGKKPRITVAPPSDTGDYFTGLSDAYQRNKYKNGSVGKEAVSAFSLDSMFIAVAQGKNLAFVRSTEDGIKPIKIEFGEVKSDGDLSGERTIDAKAEYYRSDVVNGYQSAGLDHEKEQILNRLNVNPRTFNVVKVMSALGFTDETYFFLNQDIIIDYVNELERLSSPLAPFDGNVKRTAKTNMLRKYGVPPKTKAISSLANEDASIENMEMYIKDGKKAESYVEAQHAFLNKFINLDKYGQKLLTVQTAINVDSKGFGKSIMEAQLKEGQIYQFNKSAIRIENVDSLVGDIRLNVTEAEAQKLEKEGFIISRNKAYNTIHAVDPKTVNGHAIAYGLMTNNDLWTDLFPYKRPAVDKLLDKIEEVTNGGGEELSTSSKADRRLRNWRRMKSFIFASNTLGLFDTNTSLQEERERLLIDKRDAKNQRTAESLAYVVDQIKKTDFGKNDPFLSKLEIKVEVGGRPSKITYRASRAEDLDETEQYAQYLKLITEKDQNGESPILQTINEEGETVPITFDHKPYRKRDLGQDLIAYSYITGGVQEALQFVKYNPAAYLTTLPFSKRLSRMDFMEKDFAAEGDDMIFLDKIYNIPPYVEQNIQHYPDQVPQITSREALKKDVKNIRFSSFEISPITLDKIGVSDGDGNKVPPPYVNIKGSNSTSGLKLFRYSVLKGRYVQIDTLGDTASAEYNRDVYYQRSIIKRNRSPLSDEEHPGNPGETDRTPTKKNPPSSVRSRSEDTTLREIASGSHPKGSYDNGVEQSRLMLNHIFNNFNDSYFPVLAHELLNHVDQLPAEMKVTIGGTIQDEGANGRYSYTKHNLSLFKGYDNKISEHEIGRSFMHEVIHGIAGYKVLYYENENLKTKEARDTVAYIKTIPGFVANDKDRKAVKSLKTLFNQATAEFIDKKGKREAFDDWLERNAAKEGQSPEEINEFYGFKDLNEFITLALTNENFQQMLNSVDAPSGKTFWEALKERIINLLKAMGFNADPGTILYQTIHDVLDLTDAPATEGVTNIGHYKGFRVEESSINNKRGRFGTARYDQKTGIVTVNNITIETGFNNQIWETPVKQADGTFTKPLSGDNFIIPNQWKDFVIENEIQHVLNPRSKKDKTDAAYENRMNKLALDNMHERMTEQKTYVLQSDSGTQYFYRVTLEDGILKKVEVSPDNPNNMLPVDIDDGRSIYQNLLSSGADEVSAETLTGNQFIVDNAVITPTKEQVQALDKMREFLKSTDSKDQFFLLGGYAGTGKTTLIRKIMEEFKGRTVVSAPTHKAKNQIINTTKKNGKTLQSLLGVRKRDNKFVVVEDDITIDNYDLVIVDEASMINTQSLEWTLRYATGKVILMGDDAQLPPIGEEESPVFTKFRKDKNSFQLVESQRLTGGNPLIKVYTDIRNNLDKEDGGLERIVDVNREGDGYVFTNDGALFQRKLKETFTSDQFKDNFNHARVITWKNDRADSVNKAIRDMIYTDPQAIEVGEVIVGFDSHTIDGESIVENSADYLVISKKEAINDGLLGWDVSVETVDEGRKVTRVVFVVDHNDIETLQNYKEKHDLYLDEARKNPRYWKTFNEFKAKNLILRDYGNAKKSIGYGYAITAHKAQGSTYNHAFILEDDMDRNPNIKERNRMKYVAMSRPKHTATIFNTLKRKATDGNTHVSQKPEAVKPTKPVEKPTGASPFAKMVVQPDKLGMKNTEDLGSLDITGNLNLDVTNGYEDVEQVGSLMSENLVTPPQIFVSDEELDEFMKQCK